MKQAAIYRELGRGCERKGDLWGAKSYYKLARREDQMDFDSLANLAWVEHKDNNSELAKILIKKALEAEPTKKRFKDLAYRINNGIKNLREEINSQ